MPEAYREGLIYVRLTGTLLAILALAVGALSGYAARQYAGLAPSRAEAIAVRWLTETMQYEAVELHGTQRFDSLEGSIWPAGRRVYGVSAIVAMGTVNGLQAYACLGVVVDARTGEVYGATGGEVPWLQC